MWVGQYLSFFPFAAINPLQMQMEARKAPR